MTKKQLLQSEYRKQRRRLQSTINRYRRQGLDVQFELPKIPKTITEASVRRLVQITPKQIQEQTFGVNYETGEQIAYQNALRQRRAIQRAEKARRQAEAKQAAQEWEYTHAVIQGFIAHVSEYPRKAADVCIGWLNKQIAEHGRMQVAEMLQESNQAGLWLTFWEVYKGADVHGMLNNMLDYLEVDGATRQQIIDEIDEESDIEEEFY